MKKKTSLETPEHKQTFYSRGTYCTKNNAIEIATEIPMVALSDSGNEYSLKLRNCYDISSKDVPCMLTIYSHGHPTDRRKLATENLDWDRQTLDLDSVFDHTSFPNDKILVITVHDEGFEDWHKAIYRFFVQHHVSFNTSSKDYDYDIKLLQDFIAGKYINITEQEEEPRTVGGGVLDPA
ncbi:hypothetical protein [Aquimarina sp. 2201CG5-10]|uniref:hypothetical protein n=1 Tax=Aquimarina callyspongiae TaxID=3098150 RepID=UPI002AB3DEBF|nr:hypothetical protein [Aquimarina sp. 2201CG5-10]MDY8134681.1 hypothetical protein [Aquimarina sp. 2201CG5-10]